jgi:hypothetical protein
LTSLPRFVRLPTAASASVAGSLFVRRIFMISLLLLLGDVRPS